MCELEKSAYNRLLSEGILGLSTYIKKKFLCPELLKKPQGGPETAWTDHKRANQG